MANTGGRPMFRMERQELSQVSQYNKGIREQQNAVQENSIHDRTLLY